MDKPSMTMIKIVLSVDDFSTFFKETSYLEILYGDREHNIAHTFKK